MKIGEREAAILQGYTTYRTGVPCRRGHNAERYASTGNCVQCMKDYALAKYNRTKSLRTHQIQKKMGMPELFAASVPIHAHTRFHQLQQAYLYGAPAWRAELDAAIEALLSTGTDPATGKPFA